MGKVITAIGLTSMNRFALKEDEMKTRKIDTFLRDQKGIAVPITAICIVMLLTIVALVVDLGRLYVIKAELQNAADAGAAAGAQALFLDPNQSLLLDPNQPVAQAFPRVSAPYSSTTPPGAIVPALWQPFSSPRMMVSDGVITQDVLGDNPLPGTRGARQLSIILAELPVQPVEQDPVNSCDYARAAARHTVQANKTEGRFLLINDTDIDLGVWKQNSTTKNWEFEATPCSNSTNAVKVVTRRDNGLNGPVNLIFAQILGIDSTELSAQCIAMLGWVKGIGAGKGTFPLALGDKYVPPPGQELEVTFNPNNTDTGCWHTFNDPSASANDIKKLVNGTTICPAIKCDDYINVTNGVATSVIGEVQAMFEAIKNSVATHDGTWTVILPVISWETNYVQTKKVKGFCAFRITEVNGPPQKTIKGIVLGGYIVPDAEPGGPNYGLKAGIPKLVH
jgi:hypothetical protein